MKDTNEDPVTLKAIADTFGCAASSLKNNIKSGNLVATQTNEKAAYMVRPSDAERFLRDTPGIASKFHPSAKKQIPADPGKTMAVPAKQSPKKPTVSVNPSEALAAEDSSAATVDSSAEPTPTEEAIPSGKDEHHSAADVTAANHKATQSETDPSDPSGAGTPQAGNGGKRRRPRRRGKRGGSEKSPDKSENPPVFLKALTGTSPQERLRITACLNELASLVASA